MHLDPGKHRNCRSVESPLARCSDPMVQRACPTARKNRLNANYSDARARVSTSRPSAGSGATAPVPGRARNPAVFGPRMRRSMRGEYVRVLPGSIGKKLSSQPAGGRFEGFLCWLRGVGPIKRVRGRRWWIRFFFSIIQVAMQVAMQAATPGKKAPRCRAPGDAGNIQTHDASSAKT